MIDKWSGCYDIGWGKNLVPEAFSHPAKVSFSLAGKIYDHAINEGWVKKGDLVLDCFAGIGGFGFHALCYGLNFIGVELEQKFVDLGQQNIELWNRKMKGWPKLGTATIIQGDSRNFQDVIEKADLVVSSPPFFDNLAKGNPNFTAGRERGKYSNKSVKSDYGHTSGNLANLKEGDFDMILGSPPFTEQNKFQTYNQTKGFHSYDENESKNRMKRDYINGQSPGHLGAMKEGSIDAVISSPPYSEGIGHGHAGENTDKKSYPERYKMEEKYASAFESKNNLGSMKEGGFDAVVSSPPYEKGASGQLIKFKNAEMFAEKMSNRKNKPKNDHGGSKEAYLKKMERDSKKIYGESENQLGNSSGDTFWSASREIVQQCFGLLKSNGHAIWVVKDYVKAKKRVPFSDRWLTLCESVGFKLVCRHQAMLVKYYGTQITIHGEEKIQTERKSFFRRLAESKGSSRIDKEDVICMEKM